MSDRFFTLTARFAPGGIVVAVSASADCWSSLHARLICAGARRIEGPDVTASPVKALFSFDSADVLKPHHAAVALDEFQRRLFVGLMPAADEVA